MFGKILKWWEARKSTPLDELLLVKFNDQRVNVQVIEELDSEWNQEFLWQDVQRVCFEDGGLSSSDTIYLTIANREKLVVVPTEAKGGNDFFGVICERGLLPEKVWRKAMGDTSGGLHCWPEGELPSNKPLKNDAASGAS